MYSYIPITLLLFLLSHFSYLLSSTVIIILVERSKVPLGAIISFWKPEVAVRLVTDFTIFPVNYGKILNGFFYLLGC